MLISLPPPTTFQLTGLGIDPEPIGSDRFALLLARGRQELKPQRRALVAGSRRTYDDRPRLAGVR